MKQKTIVLTLSASFVLLMSMTSCGDSGTTENSIESDLMETDSLIEEVVSEDDIFDLIETFPTPVEMAMVIKNGNHDFSSDMLLSAEGLEKFATSYDKAIALGAYGADMGYLNIYHKIFLIPDYLIATRTLSKDLDLDNFFDFDTMLELAKNSDNIDSLIHMSTESFNDMEAYLRDQGRDELSLLIVFGTWLEGSTVIAQIAKSAKSKDLYDRIAEQKIFVHELVGIFGFSDDPQFNELADKMNDLARLYQYIVIDEVFNEPTIIENADGTVTYIDNTELVIEASAEDIENIIEETIKLRNELLN